MAKKRNKSKEPTPIGTALKRKPQVGDVWHDESHQPIPSVVRIQHLMMVGKKGAEVEEYDCDVTTTDEAGHSASRQQDIGLAAFALSTMKLIEAAPEPEASSEPPADTPFSLVPIKGGAAVVCPGPECGDKHDIDDTLTWDDYQAKVGSFIERHSDHGGDSFMIIPAKSGANSEARCPGLNCGDRHSMDEATEWGEFKARVSAFIERHHEHRNAGRLKFGQGEP